MLETTQAATETDKVAPEAARHRVGATKDRRGLLWSYFWRLKWHYFPMLLSDYGRMILDRKYDAIATDHAYDIKPAGRLGPIGRAIDRHILMYPLHEGMRQRLALVAGFLQQEAGRAAAASLGPVRVLSAPCGLARDVVTAAAHLDAATRRRLYIAAADLDQSGEVLPLAHGRLEAAGLRHAIMRVDLFKPIEVQAEVTRNGPFDVGNCIGLTAWVGLAEVTELAKAFRAALRPGAGFVVDNWYQHKHSRVGRDLQIATKYHMHDAFVKAIEAGGFRLELSKDTANRTCAVMLFRAT